MRSFSVINSIHGFIFQPSRSTLALWSQLEFELDPSDVLPSGTPDYQSPSDNEVLIEPDVQASTLDITGPEAFSPSLSHNESSSNSEVT